MISTLTTFATALVAASIVSGQTSTACNPLQKTCPADPALGSSVTCDFTKGACDIFSLAEGTKLTYGDKGAVFSISTASEAPTIQSSKYIFFGKIDVVLQAAPSAGIVTSVVLESDDLDEIDWEWVGSDDAQAQTNYFSKGNTATYNRGGFSAVSHPTGTFHTYSVEWTAQAVNWMIDGTVVRTVTPASASSTGNGYPQTPMQVKIGTWVAGGPNSAPGTREWAGGYTDFSKAPFQAFYKSVTITDYAGGSGPAKGGIKEYTYGDNTGSWQSIKVVNGNGGSSSGSSSSSAKDSSSSKSSPESTKSQGSQSQTAAASSSQPTQSSGNGNNTNTGSVTASPSSTGSDSSSATTTTGPTTTHTGAASRDVVSVGVVAFAAVLLML